MQTYEAVARFLEEPGGSYQLFQDTLFGYTPAQLKAEAIDLGKQVLLDALPEAAFAIAARFNPITGVVATVYNGVTWLFEHGNTIAMVVNKVLTAVDDILAGDAGMVKDNVKEALDMSLVPVISFLAAQLKLNGLPGDVRDAVTKVNAKVNEKLDRFFDLMISKARTVLKLDQFAKDYQGLVGRPYEFNVSDELHRLWVINRNGKYVVMLGSDPAPLVPGRDLPANVSVTERQRVEMLMTQLSQAARALDEMVPPPRRNTPAATAQPPMRMNRQQLNQQLNIQVDLQKQLAKALEVNQCVRFDAACFAAGTPLLAPDGPRPIEQFRVGDLILSRSEYDPEGPLEAKVVEEVFVRTGRVLHLHVGGQVIRTTAEHPFWVRGKGWVAAREMEVGDLLLSRDGRWVAVEDLLDTAVHAPVYNLRLADYHTYFVGGWDWGFSVWAHNVCTAVVLMVNVLRNSPETAGATQQALEEAVSDRAIPKRRAAQEMQVANFWTLLEGVLQKHGVLRGDLSRETAEAVKGAAEAHGNNGRTPTITINPSAPNPFPAGWHHRLWQQIQNLHNQNPSY